MSNQQTTIALLLSALDDSYNEAICKGVNQACDENSYNLVVLPGTYLNRKTFPKSESPYTFQFTTIYEYLNQHNISGMIIAASPIGAYTSEDDMLEFLAHYKDIPKVLISSDYGGYTCINYDNSNGVRDGLEYLINTCGCRKFGVLKGPSGNTEMVQRYNTFMEVMQKHGIEITKDQICEVALSDDNHETCKNFLKKNKDIEAVSCANDNAALDLCDEIKKMGMTPGDEIKVLGYDNTIRSAKADPPLATISADPADLGREAVSYLELKMAGKHVDSFNLPATLVIRESLGSDSGRIVSTNDSKDLSAMSVDEAFAYIFYKFRGSGIIVKNTPVYQAFSNISNALKSLITAEEVDDFRYEEVVATFDRFLTSQAGQYADMNNMISYVEQLRIDAEMEADTESLVYIKNIYHDLLKILLQSVEDDTALAEEKHRKDNNAMKHFVEGTEDVETGDDEGYGNLLSHFDWLGIKNGYLYTFETPIEHDNLQPFNPPQDVYLKAFVQDGSLWKLPAEHQKISIDHIFANDFIGGNRSSMVLLPLFAGRQVYGFVMIELTNKIYPNCEFISHQLSVAARIIALLHKTK